MINPRKILKILSSAAGINSSSPPHVKALALDFRKKESWLYLVFA